MKRINKFKNFNKLFEAENPLDQAYLDQIKRVAGQAGMQKMQNGEILPPREFMEFDKKIKEIEGANLEAIESLARTVIEENFANVLDGVTLNMKIVSKEGEEFQEMHQKMVKDEEESEERKEETREENEDENNDVDIPGIEMPESDISDEVDKRKLLNVFVQGSSKKMHRLLHSETCREGLNAIHPDLFEMYDQMIKTNEVLEWTVPEEVGADAIQQGANGMNELSWENEEEKGDDDAEEFVEDCEDGECNSEDIPEMDLSGGVPTIDAIAVDFIILLHETVKGIYSLIAQNGYNNLSPEEQMRVLAQTDTLADEFHDLRYGVKIREDIVDFINVNQKINQIDNHVEFIFGKIALYPAENFVAFIWGMIQGTQEARFTIDGMIDEVYREQEEDYKQMKQWDAEQALNNAAPNIPNTNDRPEMGTSTVDDILGTTSPDVVDTNPAEPQSLDYSQMSQIDLKGEMDAALDDGDYETAKKIQPFLEKKNNNLSRYETFKRK